MTVKRRTGSTPKEKSGFNFPCEDFEQMSEMMQNLCSKGSFDCGEMMQQMFGETPNEADRQ